MRNSAEGMERAGFTSPCNLETGWIAGWLIAIFQPYLPYRVVVRGKIRKTCMFSLEKGKPAVLHGVKGMKQNKTEIPSSPIKVGS